MELLLEYANVILPAVAAALTVPIVNGSKALVGIIDRWPAWAKRLYALTVAFGLTKLGAWLNVALPGELVLLEGTHVEALLAAGLAFAFHAGDKSKSPSPAARGLLSMALLLVLPAAAACQTGRATVTVIDRSRLVVEVTPQTYTGEVGDTLTFTAVAIDSISGDTIPSIFRWSSTDTTGVRVDPSTGHATLLQAGVYDVEAMVERIVAMLITRQNDDGSWAEVFMPSRQERYAATGVVPDSLTMEVGEQAFLCAYLESDDGDLFLPDSVEWSSSDPGVVTIEPASQDLCPLWDPNLGWVSRAIRTPRMPTRFALRSHE